MIDPKTSIILVDQDDQPIGCAEKLFAHEQGLLHRAFSVFIFRKRHNQIEALLQKRQPEKYHSANLWTNACCSHPHPHQTLKNSAEQRLFEEMGIRASLQEVGQFHYQVDFPDGMTENEMDHVFVGFVEDQEPDINPEEVSEYRWIALDALKKELKQHPDQYTYWFNQALDIALNSEPFSKFAQQAQSNKSKSAFTGFSKLTRNDRLKKLKSLDYINDDDIHLLQSQSDETIAMVEQLIENAIGLYELPMGVAVNFNIDGTDRVIPMVIEETSVIAAASKMAQWIRERGHITTDIEGDSMIGQIYCAQVPDFDHFKTTLEAHQQKLIDEANQGVAASMYKRGGGVKAIRIRQLEKNDTHTKAAIHVHIDTKDAMGANFMNQVCESLRQPIENLTNTSTTMAILSNLSDTKLITAKAVIERVNPKVGEAIAEGAYFAKIDPYRAVTHNKGILNGIDAIAIATGNDWRAIEAAIHGYAASHGQYTPVTQWHYENKTLTGHFKAPIPVGVVGGVTKIHPMAHLALKLLKVTTANELARIMAAAGLTQNLAALRALVSEGIVSGHMRLHIKNILYDLEATPDEKRHLKSQLEKQLKTHGKVTKTDAENLLKRLRQ